MADFDRWNNPIYRKKRLRFTTPQFNSYQPEEVPIYPVEVPDNDLELYYPKPKRTTDDGNGNQSEVNAEMIVLVSPEAVKEGSNVPLVFTVILTDENTVPINVIEEDLLVDFVIKGSAKYSVDYELAGSNTSTVSFEGNGSTGTRGTVVIPIGESHADIQFISIADEDSEGDETIIVALTPNPTYVINKAFSSAKGIISEDSLIIKLEAISPVTSADYPNDVVIDEGNESPLVYRFTPLQNISSTYTNSAIIVRFLLGGVAQIEVDYNLPVYDDPLSGVYPTLVTNYPIEYVIEKLNEPAVTYHGTFTHRGTIQIPSGYLTQDGKTEAQLAINLNLYALADEEAEEAESISIAMMMSRQYYRQPLNAVTSYIVTIVNVYKFKVLVSSGQLTVEGFDNDIAISNSSGYSQIGLVNTGDGYLVIGKNENDYLFEINGIQTIVSLKSNDFINNSIPYFNWCGSGVLTSNGIYLGYTRTADNTPSGQNWFAVAKFDHEGGIFRSIFIEDITENIIGYEVNNYGGNLGTGSTTYEDVPVTGGTANHSRNITATPTHIYSYDLTQRFQLPVLVDGQLISVETQMLVSNSNNFSESRTESGELVETFTSGSFLPTLTDLTYTGTASMTSSESGSSSFELSFDYPFIVDSVKKVRRISNVGTRSGGGSGSVVESLDWGFAGSTASIGYNIYNTTIATHTVNGTGTSIDFAPTIILIGGSNQEIVLYYYLAIESNYTTSSGIDVNRDTTISRPRYLTTNNEFTRFSFFWGTALSPQWNVLMGDYGTINEYSQEYVYPPIESLNIQIGNMAYEIKDTYDNYGNRFYINTSYSTIFNGAGNYTFDLGYGSVQVGVSERNKGLYVVRERGTNLSYPEGCYSLLGKPVSVYWIIEGVTTRHNGTITAMEYNDSNLGDEIVRNYSSITVNLVSSEDVDFYCWANIYSNRVIILPEDNHTVSLLNYLNYSYKRNTNLYIDESNNLQWAIAKNPTVSEEVTTQLVDLYGFPNNFLLLTSTSIHPLQYYSNGLWKDYADGKQVTIPSSGKIWVRTLNAGNPDIVSLTVTHPTGLTYTAESTRDVTGTLYTVDYVGDDSIADPDSDPAVQAYTPNLFVAEDSVYVMFEVISVATIDLSIAQTIDLQDGGFQRIGNDSSSLSPLTNGSNFISYHP